MKIIEVEQGSSEWLSLREGRITGTKLGKLYSKSRTADKLYNDEQPLLGFYQLVAERLATGTGDDDGLDSSRERGHDLEGEALARAEEELGLKLRHGDVWMANDHHLASPDGWTEDLKTAVEIKCLSSARHVMAMALNEPPKEYRAEYINYFIVNPKLEALYVFLYDNRFDYPELQAVWWRLERTELDWEIKEMKRLADSAEDSANRLAASLVEKFVQKGAEDGRN